MLLSKLPTLSDEVDVPALIAAGKILLIDKPEGWTSHDIVSVVRGKTGIRRVGHCGTLDPMATGLLIVLVGRETTKLQDFFLHQDKTYEFTAELGKVTDTFDRTGQGVEEASWGEVSAIRREDLEKAASTFVGVHEQQVPMYSAVKVDGQKLYALARRGKKIKPPTRLVEIYSLAVTAFERDVASRRVFFQCTVQCKSGTYIRSLAHDIGQKLAVGATVTALRRTQIGQLDVRDAVRWAKNDSVQQK